MIKRYPPTILATACIPWDENFCFMEDLFIKEIEFLKSKNINHIYIFGTAGEGYAVNNSQFKEIVRVFSRAMKGKDLFPMVGIIDLSSDRVNEKIDIARSFKIRDFQISLPSWGELSDDEIISFMDSVLNKHKDCRFLFYNLARAKRILKPSELFLLSDRYKNLVAVKHTKLTEEDIKYISENESPLQFFLTEINYSKLSKKCECGLLLSTGNLNPDMAVKFFDGYDISFTEETAKIHEILKSFLQEPMIDGAYDKLYVKYNIMEFPLRLLKPYKYVSDDMFSDIKEKFDEIIKT